MDDSAQWVAPFVNKLKTIKSYSEPGQRPDLILLCKEIVDSMYAEFVKAYCMAPREPLYAFHYVDELLNARKRIDETLAEQQPPTVSAVPVPQEVKCRCGAQAESASSPSPTTNSAKKRRIAFEAQFLPLLSYGEIKTRKELADLIYKVDMALITAKLLANEDEEHGAITDGLLICLVKAKLKEPVVSELHDLFDDDKLYTWEEFKKKVGNPNSQESQK